MGDGREQWGARRFIRVIDAGGIVDNPLPQSCFAHEDEIYHCDTILYVCYVCLCVFSFVLKMT